MYSFIKKKLRLRQFSCHRYDNTSVIFDNYTVFYFFHISPSGIVLKLD